jgi:hypothetical protein
VHRVRNRPDGAGIFSAALAALAALREGLAIDAMFLTRRELLRAASGDADDG